MKPSEEYQQFWNALIPAYTISKGSLRVPIAINLLTLPDFNHAGLMQELKTILQNLLSKHGTKEAATQRALETGEERIVPLLTDEYTGVVRFDCVIDALTKEIKILEINCDYPDGLLLHDRTVSVLAHSESSLHEKLFTSLFSVTEAIAILYSSQAFFLDGYYAEHAVLTKTQKATVTISAALHELGEGTVRRCLEVSKLSPDDCSFLAKTARRYVNTFSLRTLGYKNLLSTIHHPYVPKTFAIDTANKHEVIHNKDLYVIKPIDGCEGNGIYFGNATSQSQWEILLSSLLDNQYVAQEYITMSKLDVSLYENDTVQSRELYFDLCPYFFIKDGIVTGNGHTLMRFSENKIVNVTKGGAIGYYNSGVI